MFVQLYKQQVATNKKRFATLLTKDKAVIEKQVNEWLYHFESDNSGGGSLSMYMYNGAYVADLDLYTKLTKKDNKSLLQKLNEYINN